MENGVDEKKNIDKMISQKGMTIIQAKDKTSVNYNKDTWTERNGQIRKKYLGDSIDFNGLPLQLRW